MVLITILPSPIWPLLPAVHVELIGKKRIWGFMSLDHHGYINIITRPGGFPSVSLQLQFVWLPEQICKLVWGMCALKNLVAYQGGDMSTKHNLHRQ